MLDTTLFQRFPLGPRLPMAQANIELIFIYSKHQGFHPDISAGFLCASRQAAAESHFERPRSGVVFRAQQASRNDMPGSGGRLRLPSLATESTNSSGGGVSQTQKEQHRVVFMG